MRCTHMPKSDDSHTRGTAEILGTYGKVDRADQRTLGEQYLHERMCTHVHEQLDAVGTKKLGI